MRSAFRALASAGIQGALVYRLARIFNLTSGLIQLLLQFVLWHHLFAAGAAIPQFTWPELRTYIVLVFAIDSLLSTQFELFFFRRIQQGTFVVDLVRPMSFMFGRLAEATGAGLVELLFRGVAALLVGILFADMLPPASITALLLFILAVALGFIIRFLLSYIVGLSCFRVGNAQGLQTLRLAITSLLSGALVPLPLLPELVQRVAWASPFPQMLSTPVSIYLGVFRGEDVVWRVAVQFGWVILLGLGAQAVWAWCMRNAIVHGG
jgi:ABC-2 type transport system permease protein